MATAEEKIEALAQRFQLVPVDPGISIGEIQEVPASMIVVNPDAPGLILQYRVNREGTETERVFDELEEVPEHLHSLSFDEGCAWLTLYDASGMEAEQLIELAERIAETIQSTNLAVPAGCFRCGNEIQAGLQFVEGRVTRICPGCLTEAVEEREEHEEILNRPSLMATIGIPGAAIFLAGGWALIWAGLQFLLDYFKVRVIEINPFTVPIYLGLIALIAVGLGYPSGKTLRNSILGRKFPNLIAVGFVLAAVVAGEIVFIGLQMLRFFGVFDLRIAAGLLKQVVASYSGFWIACKLATLLAIGVVTAGTTAARKRLTLNI